jgi:hypothetical protein
VWLIFQRYITGANHNSPQIKALGALSVANISKIHYGGKSQPHLVLLKIKFQCG